MHGKPPENAFSSSLAHPTPPDSACGSLRIARDPHAESDGQGSAAYCVDDGGELGGGGAVEDHAVAAEVELVADGGDALLGRAGGGGREPLVGDQRGDVLELLGGRDLVDRPGHARHHRVGPEPLEHRRVPAVGLHHQVAVALQVGGEPADRLLQPERLGDVVADGGEARPHLHRGGVAPGLLGRPLHGLDAAHERLVGEERVQHHVVERPAGEGQRVRAERGEPERDVLVERRRRGGAPGTSRPGRRGRRSSRRARGGASGRRSPPSARW